MMTSFSEASAGRGGSYRQERVHPSFTSGLGMGIVWVFSDTDAKPVLLKRYRCLNGAWTDTFFFLNAQ